MGRATQRAIDILELLAQDEGTWSHAEIARQLVIPKSTLTDLLRDLVQRQYLELNRNAEYLIGPRVLVISRSYLRRMDVVSRSKDILLRLSESADEAVSIVVPQQTEVVVVAQERPFKPLVAAMTLGDRGPMVATAAGKAMMAHMDGAAIAQVIEQTRQSKLPLLKPQSRTALLAELARIKAGSLAHSKQEWIDGISAIALPIVTFEGPVAAMAIAMPAARMTDKWIASVEPELRRAADELTLRMGGAATHALPVTNGRKARA
jgi:DNA-binding IclR family transcriptional regulator